MIQKSSLSESIAFVFFKSTHYDVVSFFTTFQRSWVGTTCLWSFWEFDVQTMRDMTLSMSFKTYIATTNHTEMKKRSKYTIQRVLLLISEVKLLLIQYEFAALSELFIWNALSTPYDSPFYIYLYLQNLKRQMWLFFALHTWKPM